MFTDVPVCGYKLMEATHLCVISLTSSSLSVLPQILCQSCLETHSFSLSLSLLQEAFLAEANTHSKPSFLVMVCAHQNNLLVGLAPCICLCPKIRLGGAQAWEQPLPNGQGLPKDGDWNPNSVFQTELNKPYCEGPERRWKAGTSLPTPNPVSSLDDVCGGPTERATGWALGHLRSNLDST